MVSYGEAIFDALNPFLINNRLLEALSAYVIILYYLKRRDTKY